MEREELNVNLETELIGGREHRPVVIADYDPAWPARFERERARVAAALGPAARRIEHVGSTSVPDYANAKGPLIEAILARAPNPAE